MHARASALACLMPCAAASCFNPEPDSGAVESSTTSAEVQTSTGSAEAQSSTGAAEVHASTGASAVSSDESGSQPTTMSTSTEDTTAAGEDETGPCETNCPGPDLCDDGVERCSAGTRESCVEGEWVAMGECADECADVARGEVVSCSPECPCEAGGGVCTTDEDCAGDLTCSEEGSVKFDVDGPTCIPAHCLNDVEDAGEIGIDCGGECGCGGTFSIIELELPPEWDSLQVSGMSGDGSMFIGRLTLNRGTQATAWRPDGTAILLDSDGHGQASAVTRDGATIVGTSSCTDADLMCPSSFINGAIWQDTEGPQLFARDFEPRDITATGALIVGEARGDLGFGGRLFNRGGSQLLFRSDVAFERISDDGTLLAGRMSDHAIALYSRTTGSLVDMNPPTGWALGAVADINENGTVVVGTASDDNYVRRAYRWEAGSGTTLLPLGEYSGSTGVAVTADGATIVGGAPSTVAEPVLWRGSSPPSRVRDELEARGVELQPDLQLGQARFITYDGRAVYGVILGGAQQSVWRASLVPE